MSDFADYLAEHVRLDILCLLAELPGYQANSHVLTEAVSQRGFDLTRDQMRTELAWLAEQRLVTTRAPAPGLVVASATERGLDVCAGRARVPGVRRPGPGAAGGRI